MVWHCLTVLSRARACTARGRVIAMSAACQSVYQWSQKWVSSCWNTNICSLLLYCCIVVIYKLQMTVYVDSSCHSNINWQALRTAEHLLVVVLHAILKVLVRTSQARVVQRAVKSKLSVPHTHLDFNFSYLLHVRAIWVRVWKDYNNILARIYAVWSELEVFAEGHGECRITCVMSISAYG